jgi:hypothetical protein
MRAFRVEDVLGDDWRWLPIGYQSCGSASRAGADESRAPSQLRRLRRQSVIDVMNPDLARIH